MNAFEAYQKYNAMRLHFTSNYDYKKYQGRTRVRADNFDTRKDRFFFEKLAKKNDLEFFLAVNFFHKGKIWIGDLFNEECAEHYTVALKRIQSLEYTVRNEMDQFDSYDDAFVVRAGARPRIMDAYRTQEVSPETLIVLNSCMKIFDYWDKSEYDTIFWPMQRDSMLKYAPFVEFDRKKMMACLNTLYK